LQNARCENAASLDDKRDGPARIRRIAVGLAIASHETMLAHVPSLEVLESDDNGRLVAELRLARLRSQVAIVRALADYVECLAQSGDADGLSSQIIEEMARLGCRLLEAAGALAESQPPEQSGVSVRPPSPFALTASGNRGMDVASSGRETRRGHVDRSRSSDR
jgi:hypothetical protein